MPEGVMEWFDPIHGVAGGAEVLAVQISAVDEVPEWIKQYAVDKVRHVAEKVSGPVLYASVALRHLDNPAAVRPARVAALLDVNGRAVRAHSAAPTFSEAIDDLADRLARQVRDQPRWSRPERASGSTQADAPRRFLADVATGQGAVIYRRHDGHDGTSRPVEQRSDETDVP